MKEGYKKTAIGLLPNEWKLRQVSDVIEFSGGAQPPKDTFVNEPKEGYIRLIQIRDYKTDKYKTYIPKELAKKVCCSSDIMIGRYGPPIFQILRGLEGAYNVALIKAIPDEKILNKEYARKFLSTERLFNLIDRLSQRTSGQTGIDMDALNNYLIPLPPLKEQEKIAEVLSTLDSQIDDTDKLIEKTKELKKGLMQRLLTKGIGHTEFKKTEVGAIPVEWEVRDLLSLSLTKGEYGIGAAATEYVLGKPRYLRITDIGEDSRLLNNEIRGFKESDYESFILKEGDIVFARTGNTTGKSYVYNTNDGELVYAGFLIRFRINRKLVNENYIKYILQSKRYWDWVKAMSTRSGQPGINSKEYGEFKIQLPILNEQNKISSILSSIDNQIEEYENKKIKLEELKKGLMQQLLTGKVRVI
jgi:type I restriction enzyme, S subunit